MRIAVRFLLATPVPNSEIKTLKFLMNNTSDLPSFATPEVAIFILLSFLVICLFFGKKSSITNETSFIRDSQITHIALPPTNIADERVTIDVPTEIATIYMHPSDSTLNRFFGVEFSMVL